MQGEIQLRGKACRRKTRGGAVVLWYQVRVVIDAVSRDGLLQQIGGCAASLRARSAAGVPPAAGCAPVSSVDWDSTPSAALPCHDACTASSTGCPAASCACSGCCCWLPGDKGSRTW